MVHPARLTPDKLSCNCDVRQFSFMTTAELEPLEGIIGQDRAVKATAFGLGVKRHGYNIFMTGETGTGRLSYARSVVSKVAAEDPVPDDWLYVYNFDYPSAPVALNLPAGLGSRLRTDMQELIEDLKEVIPKAFDSEDYERQKAAYVKEFQEVRSALFEELNKKASAEGFILKRTSSGFITVPVLGDQQVSEDQYASLDPAVREELEKKSTAIQLKAMEIMRRVQSAEKEVKKKFKELDSRIGLMAVGHLFDALNDRYREFPAVADYLGKVRADVLDNLDSFRVEEEDEQSAFPWMRQLRKEQVTERYQINLLIDHRETRGAPVVFESNPTYNNLLGRVEYENRWGAAVTDYMMIKGGALHRANGGYLILQALDLLSNPQAWDVLKRVLKTKELRIENMMDQYGVLAVSTLKPAPIPLNIKVILIGNAYLYHLLYYYDEDFRKLFKIKSDFELEMPNNRENLEKLARFVAAHCRQEGLKHFDRTAVARLADYSCRMAGHQRKLSTRFNNLVEILYEAEAWAGLDGSSYVSEKHIHRAIAEKKYRSNKYEQKIREMFERGQLLIATSGRAVGQINGLSVVDLGDYTFGRPSRITANTFAGRSGIVNIERESKLSGKIHDKGVLILSGYLGLKYALDTPLALSATLCFEQLYDGVDGDSASSTELYALLSSLAGVPLQQGLAVTGSVNQKGEIQPVGGINEKIEGYFAVCQMLGLNGEQGVLIPHQNEQNLMLHDSVIKAVEAGQFHIYSVRTIDEGLEILTGLPAGERDEHGKYAPDTLNGRVQQTLERYARAVARDDEEAEDDAGEDES